MLKYRQRDTLNTLVIIVGLGLLGIGVGIWVSTPKPLNCATQAQDVTAANAYLDSIPRRPLLGDDLYAGLRQQAQAQVKKAEGAQASCRLKRTATSTSSGRKDLGVKLGIAGLVIVGVAGVASYRDFQKEHAAPQPVAAAPPPPPPVQQVVAPAPVYDYPVNYPAYAESPEPEYAEPVEEAPRTRSGWGSASKRRLTFGDDEGSDA